MSPDRKDRDEQTPGRAIYFFRARLVQKQTEAPLVYEGTGKAYQGEDGAWMVEVIHEDETPHQEEPAEESADREADSVVSPFTLEAVDLSGSSWDAETVRLTGPVTALPSVGRVVRGRMEGFACLNCPESSGEGEIWVLGDSDSEP
ncbi:hypothetical protein [Thiohalorhabdus methylotrophus]|uniref:Uncharacterized protein n=1 Tax=Thiohalorhabdus methylotrophus TaxID=3242694 RepID=A0ABV4TXA3_9GAMM